MILKRRAALGWWGWLKTMLAPRKGWRRGFAYIGRRVQRLPDSPHRIALGFGCGVLASFTPFFTMHFVVAALVAFVVRGNILASALGTFMGNPLTFPFIAWSALTCGNLILGADVNAEAFDVGLVFRHFDKFLDRIFLPYLVGGVAPGVLAGTATYILVRPLVAAYQNRRRSKLMAAAKARVEASLARLKGAPQVDPAE